MKTKIILVALFFLILCCKETNKSNIIEGDIYIKLIDFRTLYGHSEENVKNLKER